MYYLYEKEQLNGLIRYKKSEMIFNNHKEKGKISLSGKNAGKIPELLRNLLLNKTIPKTGRFCPWQLDIIDECKEQALIINLKPNEKNISLYEIRKIWGCSFDEWTPVMLLLDGLFMDNVPDGIDADDFPVAAQKKDWPNKDRKPIYTFLYMNGGIKDNKLYGTWNWPSSSPTNSAVLFPDVLNYFINCIQKETPGLITNITT